MKANTRSNVLLSAGCLLLIAVACSTVPLTGRKQLKLVPSSQMLAMSLQQYDQFLTEHTKSTNAPANDMLQRVGKRIAGATEEYLRSIGRADEADEYVWEFNLIDEPSVNAWAMPGGKVVVYTGMMPVAEGETGLAVVIGHEIAHAMAHHGNERVSQSLLAQTGGTALNMALQEQPEQTQQLWMTAFGAAAQFGFLLPYSRTHESEADYIGLNLMAMAGYDPREAPLFWGRMGAATKGQSAPVWMSTHPAGTDRIQQMQEKMPEAMRYYQQATGKK